MGNGKGTTAVEAVEEHEDAVCSELFHFPWNTVLIEYFQLRKASIIFNEVALCARI